MKTIFFSYMELDILTVPAVAKIGVEELLWNFIIQV
jgi:hypothetical protein